MKAASRFSLPALLLFCLAAQEPVKNPWAPVRVNAKISDPFFQRNDFKYAWFMVKNEDGSWSSARSDNKGREVIDTTHYPVNARCFVNNDTMSLLDEAEAVLKKDTISIHLEGLTASFYANFDIRLCKDKFTSAYSTSFIVPTEYAGWETIEQDLELDKAAYKKGEEIKGRVHYKCLETVRTKAFSNGNSNAVREFRDTIRVDGVFKCKIR